MTGKQLFESFLNKESILLAANAQILKPTVSAIFKACLKAQSPCIIELAKSECNLEKGYTGLTPNTFAQQVKDISKSVGFEHYIIHADHITIQNRKEIPEIKKLISASIHVIL